MAALWLVLFFLIPFIIVLKISVSDIRLGMPPYEPLLHWVEAQVVTIQVNLGRASAAWISSRSGSTRGAGGPGGSMIRRRT